MKKLFIIFLLLPFIGKSQGTIVDSTGNIISTYFSIGTKKTTAPLTIANFTGSFVDPQAGTMLHTISDNVVNGRWSNDTYNNLTFTGPISQGRRARGTAANPLPPILDDIIMSMGGDGYGTSSFTGSSIGSFNIRAEGTFTNTSKPTYLSGTTTPSGSTTQVERFKIMSTGTADFLTNDILTTGSLGATGTRLTKGWFTNGEFSNMPTVAGVSLVSPSNLGTGAAITTKYLRGDGTWQTLAGGGDALTSNPLSQFAATTSAQLNSVISDESGTGLMLTTNGNGSSLTGLTATQVSLGNVTNESKATMFTSPTFTGTVSGVTATMVGLGNVTNESKATMFTNSVLTGITTANNLASAWTPVTSAAGTTTLTAASPHNTEITGTTTQTVVLPDATTLSVGTSYHIDNNSTGAVTVNTNGGATLIVMGGISDYNVTCTSIGTSAGTWDTDYSGRGGLNAADMYSVVGSDFTLSAALGVQSCFPTTGDVWTVSANTLYEIEGNYIMTTGTTTTKTTAIAFALSSATANYFAINVQGWNAVPGTVATAQGTVQMTSVASTVITATATTAGVGIYFKGIISIGTGGTLTPQINFSANPGGSNLMKAGSFIRFRRLGVNTFTIIGNVN